MSGLTTVKEEARAVVAEYKSLLESTESESAGESHQLALRIKDAQGQPILVHRIVEFTPVHAVGRNHHEGVKVYSDAYAGRIMGALSASFGKRPEIKERWIREDVPFYRFRDPLSVRVLKYTRLPFDGTPINPSAAKSPFGDILFGLEELNNSARPSSREGYHIKLVGFEVLIGAGDIRSKAREYGVSQKDLASLLRRLSH